MNRQHCRITALALASSLVLGACAQGSFDSAASAQAQAQAQAQPQPQAQQQVQQQTQHQMSSTVEWGTGIGYQPQAQRQTQQQAQQQYQPPASPAPPLQTVRRATPLAAIPTMFHPAARGNFENNR